MNPRSAWRSIGVMTVLCLSSVVAWADTFGTGTNQFTIDFVTISGATNPTSGYGIVNNGYRMGTLEITNAQWNKFKAGLGVPVTGSPANAYDEDPYYFTDPNMPANMISWYEAAQFVNWLNTSTGHQAAYKFTGTQGTGNYTLTTWSPQEADNGTNLYRHKDAVYYLPTEDEWVKAAYWNGTTLQTYATRAGDALFQGNGANGGWNYWEGDTGPDGPAAGLWNVGSGSQELNGTYDMMGNIYEWMESPYSSGDYETTSGRVLRGGSFAFNESCLASTSFRLNTSPHFEYTELTDQGFRVASELPEPCTLGLLALGGLALLRPRR